MSSKMIFKKDKIQIRKCRVSLKNLKVRTKECSISVARMPSQDSAGEDLSDKVSEDLSTIEKAYSCFGGRMDQIRNQNISNNTHAAEPSLHAMYKCLPLFLVCSPLPPLQPHQKILVCFEEAPRELSTFEVMDIIDLEEGTFTTSSGLSSTSSLGPPVRPIRLRNLASQWKIVSLGNRN